MSDPKEYQFDLPTKGRPRRVELLEEWYPEIDRYYLEASSKRIYHPIEGIRTMVIHATAGSSSVGAVSVIKAKKASFHWLVPDEDEEQHGHFVWATVPEKLAAWHVKNAASHPDVWGGKNKINHHSLSVEVVNKQKSNDEFSGWQIEATANIVAYCWAKYPNLRHVVSHAKVDPKRKSDPGEKFPWNDFKELVLATQDAGSSSTLVSSATPASEIDAVSVDGCCMG